MKVKIGDKIHDSSIEPILLIFDSKIDSAHHGENISNMHYDATKYCVYPDGMDKGDVRKFMKI